MVGGSCHKYHFCRDKTFVATEHYLCCDKSMLAATKVFSWQIFVVTNTCLLGQSFVATSIILLRWIFVATKLLSWQKYVCRDNSFVTTSILLSCRKTWFVTKNMSWQTFCCDKNDTFGSSCQWYWGGGGGGEIGWNPSFNSTLKLKQKWA